MAVKDELKIGLKNALNRGESLQHAMQSFVNAGYNINEVNQAATEVQNGLGTTGTTSPSPSTQQTAPNPAGKTEKPKKKIPWKIIGLSGGLLILLGVLAFILLRL